ncbi:hypothetical protein [Hyphomicrobium sp.]|uniref:hypothetical protein n=1 Tax=Hyphomicrobium sp. TaxID=82 RepID=UPI002C6599B8|nr:hypothetical protein [Hyphomicrobium sp.]HRN88504.1 hypothetical protein [Hyphomicrobium sp.]HRQ27468.1 hypothetical protein [Hyphomicrobium sp.]
MRLAILLAGALALSGAALAANAPTKQQCADGWKAEYSKMWTQAQFDKACHPAKK